MIMQALRHSECINIYTTTDLWSSGQVIDYRAMNVTGFYFKNPMALALLCAELVLVIFKTRILLGEFRSKQSLKKIVENKLE